MPQPQAVNSETVVGPANSKPVSGEVVDVSIKWTAAGSGTLVQILPGGEEIDLEPDATPITTDYSKVARFGTTGTVQFKATTGTAVVFMRAHNLPNKN